MLNIFRLLVKMLSKKTKAETQDSSGRHIANAHVGSRLSSTEIDDRITIQRFKDSVTWFDEFDEHAIKEDRFNSIKGVYDRWGFDRKKTDS